MSEPSVLDAHLHLWDLGSGDYTWNTPALGRVHASFTAADAAATLASADVAHAVLVQAADTVGDSERLFAVAARHPWVAAVVAWLPLDDPPRAARLLERWQRTGRLGGIRALLHDHPDPDLLDAPTVRRTLAAVAAHGLPLDVPDAWPRLWPALVRLADAMPELTVVLDHLGKPSLGLGPDGFAKESAELRRWEHSLRQLARRPSVVAKLSGLDATLAPGVRFTARAVGPVVQAAIDAFGPDRLMFGGDWPVSLGHTGYPDLVSEVRAALADLDAPAQAAVLHETARRVYGVAP